MNKPNNCLFCDKKRADIIPIDGQPGVFEEHNAAWISVFSLYLSPGPQPNAVVTICPKCRNRSIIDLLDKATDGIRGEYDKAYNDARDTLDKV